MDSFWEKVDTSGECWPWLGSTRKGYGAVRVNGSYESAHRVSARLAGNDVPKNAVVMHTCDNPLCVNPEHLVVGTQSDNIVDMVRKGRGNFKTGEEHGRSTLTWDDVRNIRRRAESGESQRTLASRYGVSSMQVSRIVRGERWKEAC